MAVCFHVIWLLSINQSYLLKLYVDSSPVVLYSFLARPRALGPVSISYKTSYHKIIWSIEPRDWYFKLSRRFEIWQAHWQHYCRGACQISEQSHNSKYKSRSTKSRLLRYWKGPWWNLFAEAGSYDMMYIWLLATGSQSLLARLSAAGW